MKLSKQGCREECCCVFVGGVQVRGGPSCLSGQKDERETSRDTQVERGEREWRREEEMQRLGGVSCTRSKARILQTAFFWLALPVVLLCSDQTSCWVLIQTAMKMKKCIVGQLCVGSTFAQHRAFSSVHISIR